MTNVSLWLCVALLLLPSLATGEASLPPTVIVRPNPASSADPITVSACYPAGPYVWTMSSSVNGSVATVRFVQDGFDFSPNPPHCASVQIGPLAPSTYRFEIISRTPPSAPNTQNVVVVVTAVPVPVNRTALAVLALLLLAAACVTVQTRQKSANE